jgi:hypothetical protein
MFRWWNMSDEPASDALMRELGVDHPEKDVMDMLGQAGEPRGTVMRGRFGMTTPFEERLSSRVPVGSRKDDKFKSMVEGLLDYLNSRPEGWWDSSKKGRREREVTLVIDSLVQLYDEVKHG